MVVINCYITNILEYRDVNVFLKGISLIPKDGLWRERIEQISRLRTDEDKYRSISASLLLLFLLKKNKVSHTHLAKSVYGKLYLSYPNGYHFNLSHSGKYTVCSFGHSENGIDIQEETDDLLDISSSFFCLEEHNLIKKNDSKMFTRIWSIKESYIKYLGFGLQVPLNSFNVHPGETRKNIDACGNSLTSFDSVLCSQTIITDRKRDYYLGSPNSLFWEEFIIDRHHVSVCSKKPINNRLLYLSVKTILDFLEN